MEILDTFKSFRSKQFPPNRPIEKYTKKTACILYSSVIILHIVEVHNLFDAAFGHLIFIALVPTSFILCIN